MVNDKKKEKGGKKKKDSKKNNDGDSEGSESENESNAQANDVPRNPDGTMWKNPLKGWNNMPVKRAKVTGAEISMRIPPKTDWWRKTRNDFNRNNAPFHWHKVTGDFEVTCKVSGGLKTMYDKAGIMARLDDEHWLMTGMELFNQRMNHSTCVTKDHTDWSLTPLPENAEKSGIWFKLRRSGEYFECLYSFDAKTWIQTRECTFTARPILYVGICGGSPIGDGFKASWDFFRCRLF